MADAVVIMHVTHGENKKRLECPAVEIKDVIERSFGLAGQDYLLQSWDTFFDDWVDVDLAELSRLEKFKLKVVLRSVLCPKQRFCHHIMVCCKKLRLYNW